MVADPVVEAREEAKAVERRALSSRVREVWRRGTEREREEEEGRRSSLEERRRRGVEGVPDE
jgi:hypothetical protein